MGNTAERPLSSQGLTGKPPAVIWMGSVSPLLNAAWSLGEICHVHDTRSFLRALEHRLGSVVVIDVDPLDYELAALINSIRMHWPHLGILLLVDDPAAAGENVVFADVDRVLRRTADPADLDDALQRLVALAAERLYSAGDSQWQIDDIPRLQDRMRNLEGLLRATFTVAGVGDARDILGDLPGMAHVAVDADDIAVLLTDRDFTDLEDSLGMGVPKPFIEVCRELFLSLPPEDRPSYVGDELLLRERVPGMLPTAARVREAEAAQAWSYMRLPLVIDEQLIGFVALFSNVPGRFNGAHLQLGRLFVSQVANAVRNMQLFLRLNRAEQRQRAVGEVAHLIAEDLALEASLARIVEQAVGLVGGDAGLVLLIEPDEWLVVRAVHGLDAESVGRRIAPGVGQAGRVALSGQFDLVTDFADWEPSGAESRSPDSGQVLFGAPLIYRGGVLGVLQVVGALAPADRLEEAREVLMMLAPQAATVIAKAQLHEVVRHERQQLRAILDHTSAAVMVFDADGHLVLHNPEAERIFERLELSPKVLQRRSVLDLMRDVLPDSITSLPDIGGVLEMHLGDVGEYLVHIAPIARVEGIREQFVAVAQDVTELRRVDRMKSNLTRVLTHDLGSMMMLVRNPLELLEEPDLLPDQRDHLRAMLTGSLERMSRLIKDVQDLEMASALGRDTMQPYDLVEIIGDVCARNQALAEKEGLTFAYEEESRPKQPLIGHPFLVAQAIDNLVNNAVKYTPAGGAVTLTLLMEADQAVIRVQDTGLGIPADRLQLIFDPFYRVKSKETVHIQGTGMGLSLVRTIAELHGGQVTVSSTPGEGSVFTLMLPPEPTVEDPAANSHLFQLDLSGFLDIVLKRRNAGPGQPDSVPV